MKSQSSRNSEIKLTRAVLSFKGNFKNTSNFIENDSLKGAKMSLLEPSNSLKTSKKKSKIDVSQKVWNKNYRRLFWGQKS